MDLREKVADVLDDWDYFYPPRLARLDAADAILAIPEIAEAVAVREEWLDQPSSPPLKTGDEVRAHFRSIGLD